MSSDRHAGHQKPVTGEEFRKACGRFATGVTIASVMDAKGTPHGLTVSSFTSVSLDPPLVLICLGHAVAAIHHFRSATHFAINVLAEDQRPLSDRFARKGHDRFEGVDWTAGASGAPLILICLGHAVAAIHHFRAATHFGINVLAEDQRPLSDRFARKGHDRFEAVEWYAGANGVPLIPGVLATMECAVHRIVPMGDHDILVGEMLHAKISEGQPLLYFASGYTHL